MERKIGETFDFIGTTLEVVEQDLCEGCYFFNTDCARFQYIRGECGARSDGKYVIFKKVDSTIELLTKAHEELVRCGIESEIMDEIEEYLNKTK